MLEIQSAGINTAGAYVCINGLYLFAIGIQPRNGHIPVVRLGGHREGNETGWGCAVREVYEESNLQIKPLLSQTTYLCDWDHLDAELQEMQWRPKIEQEPAPVLVITYRREEKTQLSIMYLAQADGVPTPSSEVRGLLLLEKEEIHRLCREPLSLEGYLARGGRAILNAEFDTKLLLEPFAQLRLLSRILNVQPEIETASQSGERYL
jgi:8-oxo-dGTP pyrophosphatase MutT (NUDIX family)